MVLGDVPLLPQCLPRLGIVILPERAQVHAGGDDLDPAVNAVPPQQLFHLLGGRNNARRMPADPAGKGSHHIPPHPAAEVQVVGVILVHRVVGMDNRRPQPVGQGRRHPERAELTLTVDYIRLPVRQLPEQASGPVHFQTRAGVNPVRADGTHVVDIAVLIGVHTVG